MSIPIDDLASLLARLEGNYRGAPGLHKLDELDIDGAMSNPAKQIQGVDHSQLSPGAIEQLGQPMSYGDYIRWRIENGLQ